MSVVRSTHVPPQSVCPAGQPQTPAEQVWPAAQALPQAPQLSASLWKLAASTQPVPHCEVPAGQVATQAPLEQNGVPAGQAMPQAPQLAPSAMVLAQPAAHGESPAWHMQVPLHTWPAVQAVSHVPQCATSEEVFTHAPPHAISGAGQLQLPFTQVCVAPQTLPQAPQLDASTEGFTQNPAHGASPTGHWPLLSVMPPPTPAVLLIVPLLPEPPPPGLLGPEVCGVELQLSAIKLATTTQAPSKNTRSQRATWVGMICGISSTWPGTEQALEFSRAGERYKFPETPQTSDARESGVLPARPRQARPPRTAVALRSPDTRHLRRRKAHVPSVSRLEWILLMRPCPPQLARATEPKERPSCASPPAT
jgi:hypothetical protein